jgi:hypothetical protein
MLKGHRGVSHGRSIQASTEAGNRVSCPPKFVTKKGLCVHHGQQEGRREMGHRAQGVGGAQALWYRHVW